MDPQKRNVRLIWLGLFLGIGALITLGILWKTRDRLSVEEQAQFEQAMTEALARTKAWEKARKEGVIKAYRAIDTLGAAEACPAKLPTSLQGDPDLHAQLIPETALDEHYGMARDSAVRYLGLGEPGVDRFGYLNQAYLRLLKGRNLRPKEIEWPKLLKDIDRYSRPPFWKYELLFVAVKEVKAVAELDKEKFTPGMAAGWALLWDFEQGRVVCHAPFVARHSSAVNFLQTYEVDTLGDKRSVNRGEGARALAKDIMANAYRFALPRLKKTKVVGAD